LTGEQWLLVALCGAVGAPLRYVIDTLVSRRSGSSFPFGTLTVNISGSFVLGIITGLVMYHGLGPTTRLAVGTGLIGAYTTFSTFSYETLALFEEGETSRAVGYLGVSLLAGGLAAAAGLALAAV
jgi:fluoride exporter